MHVVFAEMNFIYSLVVRPVVSGLFKEGMLALQLSLPVSSIIQCHFTSNDFIYSK